MYKCRVFIVVVFVSCIFISDLQANKLVTISNKYLEAGFLPDVGGRMVYFAPLNGENFLYSDSALWNEPLENRIDPQPDSPFKAYNGHITWLGPQSDWWVQQDFLPAKRERADLWPPDPYLLYSTYAIIDHTDTSIVLRGTESPVSGLMLEKRYTLNKNELEIEISAVNCRDTQVSWDIWSNARFDAYTIFRVPVNENSSIRIEAEDNERQEIMEHKIEDGYFTFKSEMPENPDKLRLAKAYIYPAEGKMFAVNGDYELEISFDLVPAEQIHPNQALVEVYNSITQSGNGNLLELEHHSKYKTYEPGEKFVFREKWIVAETECDCY